ncbi:MAG: hypothetical protein ACOCXM_10260 [Myxococcota bacterium]
MRTVFAFPRLTPVVRKLLFLFLGAFVLELLLDRWAGVPLYQLFALAPGAVGVETLWQLATHVLVWPPDAGSVLPVLIGLVFLWWMMAPFEERFGGRRTWQLALVGTFSASVPALLVGLLMPQPYRLSGFNPILLSTIAAFAWSLRHRGHLMLFGVVRMKAVHLIFLVVGVSLLFFLASGNVLDLVADLGAVGGGMGFIEWMSRPPGRRRRPSRGQKKRKAPFKVVQGGGSNGDGPRWLN